MHMRAYTTQGSGPAALQRARLAAALEVHLQHSAPLRKNGHSGNGRIEEAAGQEGTDGGYGCSEIEGGYACAYGLAVSLIGEGFLPGWSSRGTFDVQQALQRAQRLGSKY
eukprot:scaffold105169_cov18-Tisochrysis_lutea.AAC.3